MKVLIIAEAGVNHNGDIVLAKKLVDAASNAGADIIKFQTFSHKHLLCVNTPKAEYQNQSTPSNESQYEMIKKLEMSKDMHLELIHYCKQKNICFLSSAFDLDSLEYLKELGMKIYKIPSGEINNLPYLKKVGSYKSKIILSTGMSTIREIETAIEILIQAGTKKDLITVLHCNTEYPTPFEDVNLKAMITIGKTFNISIGYSDHTLGIEVPIAAVALGASVVEKHITISRNLEGPDHKASIEPKELKDMVKSIRNIELALGNGIKSPTKSEEKNKAIARKSIVALKTIKAGEKFSDDNLTTKRPGNGISPMEWNQVIGLIARKDFEKDDLISR